VKPYSDTPYDLHTLSVYFPAIDLQSGVGEHQAEVRLARSGKCAELGTYVSWAISSGGGRYEESDETFSLSDCQRGEDEFEIEFDPPFSIEANDQRVLNVKWQSDYSNVSFKYQNLLDKDHNFLTTLPKWQVVYELRNLTGSSIANAKKFVEDLAETRGFGKVIERTLYGDKQIYVTKSLGGGKKLVVEFTDRLDEDEDDDEKYSLGFLLQLQEIPGITY
jgi:hypothetical protein